MDSFELLPKQKYSSLCEQLKEDLPRSLKIVNILMIANPTSSEECYVRKHADGNVDASVVIVKISDILSILQDCYGKTIAVYCKIPDMLADILHSCNVIDWSAMHLVMDVSEDELPFFRKVSEQHNGRIKEFPINTFYLEDAARLNTEIPEDVELIQLTPEMVDTVKTHWRFGRFCSREDLTATLIREQGRGMALVKKTNPKEMIAWIGLNQYGRIGFLNTLPEHRNKGYGSIVVAHFAKELLKIGQIPSCHISPENKASENLFVKLGFKLESVRPNFFLFYLPRTEEAEAKHKNVLKEMEKVGFVI